MWETKARGLSKAAPYVINVVSVTILTITGYRKFKFASEEEAWEIVSILKDGSRCVYYLIEDSEVVKDCYFVFWF